MLRTTLVALLALTVGARPATDVERARKLAEADAVFPETPKRQLRRSYPPDIPVRPWK